MNQLSKEYSIYSKLPYRICSLGQNLLLKSDESKLQDFDNVYINNLNINELLNLSKKIKNSSNELNDNVKIMEDLDTKLESMMERWRNKKDDYDTLILPKDRQMMESGNWKNLPYKNDISRKIFNYPDTSPDDIPIFDLDQFLDRIKRIIGTPTSFLSVFKSKQSNVLPNIHRLFNVLTSNKTDFCPKQIRSV